MLFYTCQLLDAFVHPLTSKFLLSISFLPLSFTLILSFITVILRFFAVLELSMYVTESNRIFRPPHTSDLLLMSQLLQIVLSQPRSQLLSSLPPRQAH